MSSARVRSLRIRSRLQKKTAIAAAIGTATASRLIRSISQSLEERRVRLLDGLQRDPLGRVDAGTTRILDLVVGR